MTSIEDLSGVNTEDIICSVWNKTNKKWKRIIEDKEGNNVYIHKLKVERQLNESKHWIICLYKQNRINNNDKYVFYLHIDKIKVKV